MPQLFAFRRRFLLVLALAAAPALGADDAPDAADAESPDPVRARFETIDTDRDGTLSAEELFRMYRRRIPVERADDRRIAQQVGQTLAFVDGDGDRALSLAEFRTMVPDPKRRAAIPDADFRLYEGGFTQCSFNALASVLIHFYGPTPEHDDRADFESRTFHQPLAAMHFGGYYGWAPWTGYMVESDKVVWNGPVTDLEHENFRLRPAADPTPDLAARTITVRYADGERERLEAELLRRLERGPVIIWTPYAAVLTRHVDRRWRHVEHVDDQTDVVPFGPFTHAVALFLKDDGRILVSDGAVPDGVFYTDARTIVATASAMAGFIRIRDGGGGAVIDRVRGIEDERYNVVFWRTAADPDAAAQPAPAAAP